jgi:hypothetical protein
MPVVPARDDPGIGAAQPAEGDQKLRVLGDVGPRHRTCAQGEVALLADDVGLHHHARATAVVVDRAGVAADPVQETMELALGVVEAPGTGPAVRAAEDRLVTERGAHAVQLVSEQIKRGGPINLDVLVVGAATVIIGARAVLEPPAAQGGAGDAGAGILRVGDVGDRRGRIGVIGVRPGADDVAMIVNVDQIGAPVGARLHLTRHDTHVPTKPINFNYYTKSLVRPGTRTAPAQQFPHDAGQAVVVVWGVVRRPRDAHVAHSVEVDGRDLDAPL